MSFKLHHRLIYRYTQGCYAGIDTCHPPFRRGCGSPSMLRNGDDYSDDKPDGTGKYDYGYYDIFHVENDSFPTIVIV